MREFQLWAKARGITFKRQRDERSAFNVWKACKEDLDIKDRCISDLNDELVAVGKSLQELSADLEWVPVEEVSSPRHCEFGGIVNQKSYGEFNGTT